MNEENIINEIDFCLAGEYITVEHRQAIEGLLDLYNQEKETSHYLQNRLDVANAKLIEEKEKNKKTIEYINRVEINSIGTPLSYTSIGKDLLKILKNDKARGEENE